MTVINFPESAKVQADARPAKSLSPSNAAKRGAYYRFEVLGHPVPWERARRQGKRYFTSDVQAVYRNQIRRSAKDAGVQMVEGPVYLNVIAWISPPASWSKRRREEAIRQEAPVAVKPDVDNFLKQVMDALEGVAFENDSRVCYVVVRKLYSDRPRLWIAVGEL